MPQALAIQEKYWKQQRENHSFYQGRSSIHSPFTFHQMYQNVIFLRQKASEEPVIEKNSRKTLILSEITRKIDETCCFFFFFFFLELFSKNQLFKKRYTTLTLLDRSRQEIFVPWLWAHLMRCSGGEIPERSKQQKTG